MLGQPIGKQDQYAAAFGGVHFFRFNPGGAVWYMTYGLCENTAVAELEALLPMGLAEGCRLTRDVRRDKVLTYADVELPAGRLADTLRAEQRSLFAPATVGATRLSSEGA